MDVSEDEIQTLRAQVLREPEDDPRWKQWFIADMPTPGRTLAELKRPAHKKLAALLYPYYDSLSHFSHGGLVGVMAAAILRRDLLGDTLSPEDRRGFWYSGVLATALPLSYVAMLFVATLAASPYLAETPLREALLRAWRPYHSDGSPLGVAVWDTWAAELLGEAREGTEGPAGEGEPGEA
jgi:hypothetical protein